MYGKILIFSLSWHQKPNCTLYYLDLLLQLFDLFCQLFLCFFLYFWLLFFFNFFLLFTCLMHDDLNFLLNLMVVFNHIDEDSNDPILFIDAKVFFILEEMVQLLNIIEFILKLFWEIVVYESLFEQRFIGVEQTEANKVVLKLNLKDVVFECVWKHFYYRLWIIVLE